MINVLTCRNNRFRYCRSEYVSIYSRTLLLCSGVAYRILDDQTRSLLLCGICFEVQSSLSYRNRSPKVSRNFDGGSLISIR